jgi:hypothetical protein
MFGQKAILRIEIAALKNANERLQHDYDNLRADYSRLVDQLGSVALGKSLQGKWDLGNADPYTEDSKQPDVYLTPAEEEILDMRKIEEELIPSAD